MTQSKQKGKNIKLFDKIKLQHVQTTFRIHCLQHEWKNGSYNQAIGCHKSMDETDWFIVLKIEVDQNTRNNLSYHFQYGDKIYLSNVSTKKYLHVTDDFQSEVSKNMEVSLCENGEGHPGCQEDQWEVVKTAVATDNYWRVGQHIKLKNVHFDSFLCSHHKKLRQSGDNQVFVRSPQKSEKHQKKKTQAEIQLQQQWVVSQIQSFIYSANLTDKKQIKKTQQAEQIQNLKKMKSQMVKKTIQINPNSTQDLLKIGNERLAQIQTQKLKVNQSQKNDSIWTKIFKCGFCCPKEDGYHSLN